MGVFKRLNYTKWTVFLFSFFFLTISAKSTTISGIVTDELNQVVSNAQVEFFVNTWPNKKYVAQTNASGEFNMDVSVGNNPIGANGFWVSKPLINPFSDYSLFQISLPRAGQVLLELYGINGQKVMTERYTLDSGISELKINRNINGRSLSEGFYIYSITFEKRKSSGHIAITNIPVSSAKPYLSFQPLAEKVAATGIGTIKVTKSGYESYRNNQLNLSEATNQSITLFQRLAVRFKTQGEYLAIYNGETYDNLFIKGINLGVAVPGTSPGELASTAEQYRRWFERIGQAGFNAIRVYTLHFPRFYEELDRYNRMHPDKPLYVFHGVWLEEDYPANCTDHDLYCLTDIFEAGLKEVVDCIHGNKTIEQRFGRAYGDFTVNISPWVIGYIIGREVHPTEIGWHETKKQLKSALAFQTNNNPRYKSMSADQQEKLIENMSPEVAEVLVTNYKNQQVNSFDGEAVSLPTGNAYESWIAARVNSIILYERTNYQTERPISFSSWPTLDPIEHPTEPDWYSSEDLVQIDLENLDVTNAPAGYFVSFHAYPYYPDFISEDPNYRGFSDDMGPNSYLGYLTDLQNHYQTKPLLIGEFGVPSSWANAHFAHSGMNMGGMTEQQQGEYGLRILRNIEQVGAGGGMLFAWMDEWFKNAWITEPFSSGIERRMVWHNVLSPEENFGLISFEPNPPDYSVWQAATGTCGITQVKSDYDFQFFYANVTTNKTQLVTGDTLWVAFDTYDKNLGESRLPNGKQFTNRAEFLLRVTPDSAVLFVTEAYDLFNIWHGESAPEQLYQSVATDGKPWKLWRLRNNWNVDYSEPIIHEIGKLRIRTAAQEATNLDAVVLNGANIEIRIPWSLLLFADPSQMTVVHDDRATWWKTAHETRLSDGISLTVFLNNCKVETPRYSWPTWNDVEIRQNNLFFEREKKSLHIIENELNTIGILP